MLEIMFDRPTHFDAHGRNGYVTAAGVAIFDMEIPGGLCAEIHLQPITGKGRVSEACRIPIRKTAIPAVIAELQKFIDRPGERDVL
jgi:hypothetical protein